MQKIICEIVKGWASREWPVLCFQDPSYREHWEDSRPAVCPQVCICICILYLYSICILICICIWICIGKSASCYEPIWLPEWTSSATSPTQRATPQPRRTSALRTTRRSASSNTPRPGQNIFEHTQVQKKLSSNERHSHFGVSICPYHNNGDFSVEETIEKCYHPMERLCAPPAYGEEPAEVFNLTLLDFCWGIFSAFLAIYFLHVMVISTDIFWWTDVTFTDVCTPKESIMSTGHCPDICII